MTTQLQCGIRLHDTTPGTLTERLAGARAQGFCCAHLALSKVLPGFSMADAPALLTDALAEEVSAAFSENHMRCVLLGCYLQLAQREAADRERIQAIYRAHLRFARLMGARVVGTETPAKGLTFADGPARDSEEAFQLFLAQLRPLLQVAEEENVFLAVEPVFCDIISTPARAERLLNEAHSDRLKIILDGVNLLSNEGALHPATVVDEAIRRLGDAVVLLHMKDFRLESGRDRPESIACGQGSMPYGSLLAFAKARSLPMTLENTSPANAEATRLYLEHLAAAL